MYIRPGICFNVIMHLTMLSRWEGEKAGQVTNFDFSLKMLKIVSSFIIYLFIYFKICIHESIYRCENKRT